MPQRANRRAPLRECVGATVGRHWPPCARRWLGLLTACLLLAPLSGWAHSAQRGLVMLLPTGYYLAAGTLAVVVSCGLLVWLPVGRLRQLAAARLPLCSFAPPSPVGTSLLSTIVLALLIVAGLTGARDPLTNPLPPVIWSLWWVGFPLLQCVVGDLWPRLNPWSGLLRLLRCCTRRGVRPWLRLPRRLGYLPAIGLFFGFAWFELIDPAPRDPARLALAVALYWLLNFIGMMIYGEAAWLRRAEPFAIFFRLIGHCSPLLRERLPTARGARRRIRICLTWPGRPLLRLPPLPLSGTLFVVLTLSAVSFDGLSKTFFWLAAMGLNPLSFAGRSAVQLQNTLGLLAAFLLLAGLFFLAVYGGWRRHARRPLHRAEWLPACGRLVYSLIPISLVFHGAHYLTALLLDGQYALIALSDPFARGWNLLQLAPDRQAAAGWLNNLDSVTLIWRVQTIVIVTGHIIGVVVAHLIALDLLRRHSNAATAAAASQLFLAGLMAAYTLFGLWLLSTPAIG